MVLLVLEREEERERERRRERNIHWLPPVHAPSMRPDLHALTGDRTQVGLHKEV